MNELRVKLAPATLPASAPGRAALDVPPPRLDEEGQVRAVVGFLDRLDRDKEIILGSAVTVRSNVVLSAFSHAALLSFAPPVGAGVITVEQGGALILDGRFFLDSAAGRDAYATVRGLGRIAQWSIGFRVLQARKPTAEERERGAQRIIELIELIEVSPVVVGAMPGTHTQAVRSAVDARNAAAQSAELCAVRDNFLDVSARVRAAELRAQLPRIAERYRHLRR